MFEDPADVPAGGLGQVGLSAFAEEQRLASFPEALVHVHATAVVVEHWLGHECGGFAVLLRHIANDIFVGHGVVRRLDQLGEFHAEFVLTCTGNFMVMLFDGDP